MPSGDGQLRQALVAAGRRLSRQGLVAGTGGNLSARLDERRILVTPSGVSKGEMEPDDLVMVALDSGVLQETAEAIERARAITSPAGRRPTSEIGMHLALYLRTEVGAVVHAHPPYATSFAAAGIDLGLPLLAEQVLMLGEVPLLPFAAPSTPAVARAVGALSGDTRAFLLANHGATTVGASLDEAVTRMETLEACARVAWLARCLDPDAGLQPDQIADLKELKSGGSGDGAGA